MDMLPIAFLLISFGGVALSVPSVSISSDPTVPSSKAFSAGQVVIIICSTTEGGAFDVIELRAEKPEGIQNVATNQVLEDAYQSRKLADGSNRYRPELTYDQSAQVGTLVVTVNGAQAEDSGIFYCMLRSSEQGEYTSEKITIAIQTPVIDVSMGFVYPNGTTERVSDDSTVSFAYGVQQGIACIVSIASYVIEPVQNVTVNGAAYTTEGLIRNRGAPKLASGETMVYEYTYKYLTSEPGHTLDESLIRCTAYAEGFENEVKEAQVRSNATYKPVIACADFKPKAVEGGDGTLMCTVFAKPAVTSIKVNFGMTLADNEQLFESGSTVFLNKYTLTREDDGRNSTITFNVAGMTPALFDSYVYQIKAESSIGTTIERFSFERGIISGTSRSSSCSALIAFLSSSLLLMRTFYQL